MAWEQTSFPAFMIHLNMIKIKAPGHKLYYDHLMTVLLEYITVLRSFPIIIISKQHSRF